MVFLFYSEFITYFFFIWRTALMGCYNESNWRIKLCEFITVYLYRDFGNLLTPESTKIYNSNSEGYYIKKKYRNNDLVYLS